MTPRDDTGHTSILVSGAQTYRIADLPVRAGAALQRLPWVHRILLENALRLGSAEDAAKVLQNDRGEIAFYPGRVLMHDTTCGPALADIAAMRSVLAENGYDPLLLNPTLPIDVSTDHSLPVDVFAVPDAALRNMANEYRRNQERYRFMKWAAAALKGLRVHPPGTGIMHTINLERLASVVVHDNYTGAAWAFPDTLIGTDSHTPMINGIGVLAWGVGGLEAESVMFGMPVMLPVPEVIGVRLYGSLPEGVLATDLALTVTERLRRTDLAGRFVEFFGPGVGTLSAGERCVVANMAPEYGASTGYFPIDANTLRYLEATGR
ncbi:MAG: aconitate hydratase AcnA, partial [Rhodospirillaceae bacterium]|nr:aconitate hydratase AcnA [Rhodospirillaceae bacterium]